MPTPEPRPPEDPSSPSIAVDRGFEPIDADALDKENRAWVLKYLDGLKLRLGEEQSAPSPDREMIRYFKREMAAYQELIERAEAGGA